MSTATVAAGTVRPLNAIRADMANVLANKPESILADVKAAIVWLPRNAAAAIMRAARFLHVPQLLAFVRRNLQKFISVVGVGPFVTEMLTSHWGQKTISKTISTGAAITKWAIKWSWKILTSPGRIFKPTRDALEKVDAAVAKADRKLTPGSGECVGPVQIVHDVGADFISPNAAHMKMARITAFAVASVRATRRFVPVGWLRVLTYILDGAIVAHAYRDTLKDSALGRWADKKSRKTWAAATAVEADIVVAGENASAEATRLTREAAEKSATKLRKKAETVEADAAATVEAELVKAAELRQEADAMEATAERMAAAETASAVTESLQTEAAAETGAAQAATAVMEAERPKPGPSVPPLGGRTPSSGPQQQPHQQHGGRQTPKKR